MDKGVVVDLGNDIEGFVPMSQLGVANIENPGDAVKEGQPLDLKVLEVDPIHHRIVLAVVGYPDEPIIPPVKPVYEESQGGVGAAAERRTNGSLHGTRSRIRPRRPPPEVSMSTWASDSIPQQLVPRGRAHPSRRAVRSRRPRRRAYLATVPADVRARSDAYTEGGYWIQVWGVLLAAAILLAAAPDAAGRGASATGPSGGAAVGRSARSSTTCRLRWPSPS